MQAQIERQEKLLTWGGFDDKQPAEKVTVILKNMFSPAELLEDFTLAEDLEKDVFAECNKMGPVDKVRSPAGSGYIGMAS